MIFIITHIYYVHVALLSLLTLSQTSPGFHVSEEQAF